MGLKSISPNSDFTLNIETEDGKAGIFSIKPYLELEVFKSLNNLNEFFKVYNRKYYIEWQSGADLSYDTIVKHTVFR